MTIIGSFWWTVSKLRGAPEGFRLEKTGSSYERRRNMSWLCVYLLINVNFFPPHLSCWTNRHLNSGTDGEGSSAGIVIHFFQTKLFLTVLIALMWQQLSDSYLHVHVNQKVGHIVN